MRTSVPTAEMVKYASNAFLATKISFINEIANVCEQVGADVRTVARGMGLDHRIGPHFLQAGIGYGGSCFPKDVQALKQLAGNTGYHFQLLNAVIEVNALQKRRVVGKLKERLGSAARHHRRAARAHLQAQHRRPARGGLHRAGRPPHPRGRPVKAYDPMLDAGEHPLFPGVVICEEPLEALAGADAAVLVTEWQEFGASRLGAPPRARMARPLLIDGRNFVDPAVAADGRARVRGRRPGRRSAGARRRLSRG